MRACVRACGRQVAGVRTGRVRVRRDSYIIEMHARRSPEAGFSERRAVGERRRNDGGWKRRSRKGRLGDGDVAAAVTGHLPPPSPEITSADIWYLVRFTGQS